MRYDIQKLLFLTKKLVELKSVRLFKKAYRSKFKNRPCPLAQAITKLSKKFDSTGIILDLPSKPKYSSPKIVDQKSLS